MLQATELMWLVVIAAKADWKITEEEKSYKTTTIKSSRERPSEDKKTQKCLQGGRLLEECWLEQFRWNHNLQHCSQVGKEPALQNLGKAWTQRY